MTIRFLKANLIPSLKNWNWDFVLGECLRSLFSLQIENWVDNNSWNLRPYFVKSLRLAFSFYFEFQQARTNNLVIKLPLKSAFPLQVDLYVILQGQ